ncbi:hypothetical protein [Parasediminibacterium sp. JCM 36343]|uniref:hypothetical protein n=1 Tax=Parasediminibacterium sp. JCM 36343 TaxID=3374279 RepID=UPI00397A6260
MKKSILVTSAAAVLMVVACNNNTTPANAVAPNADSAVTTTTTTKTVYSKRRLEGTKLVDIQNNKTIVLKYDTVHYYYVDAATNEPPKSYYYDEATKDTFDYRGYLVNNSLIAKDGNYTVDEAKLMDNPYNVEVKKDMVIVTAPDSAVSKKMKDNGNAYKEKTDTSKVKITSRKTKIKIKNDN